MRKRLICLAVTAAMLMNFPFSVGAEATNLIENSSFEENTDGWSYSNGLGTANAEITRFDGESYEGENSLLFAVNSARYWCVGPTANIGFQKGKYYLATAWVRGKASGGSQWGTSVGFSQRTENFGLKVLYNDYSEYETMPNVWSVGVLEKSKYSSELPLNKLGDDVWSDWKMVSNIIYAEDDVKQQIGLSAANAAATHLNIDAVSLEEVTPVFEIDGYEEIDIPKYGQQSNTVAYSFTKKLNDRELPGRVTYSLANNYEGVSIDEHTGIVSVTSAAHIGVVTINAEYMANKVSKNINLTYSGDTAPQVRNPIIVGSVVEGSTLTISYTPYDPNGLSVTAKYKWYGRKDNGDWEIIENAADKFLVPQNFEYEYVRAGIEIINFDELSSGEVYTSEASIPAAPKASNVRIAGDVSVGNTVRAVFDFTDINNDNPGTHIYTWLQSETDGGTYEEIQNDSSEPYMFEIPHSLVGKYIKVKVIPVSVNEPYCGEPAESNAYFVRKLSHIANGTFEEGVDGWTYDIGSGTRDSEIVRSDDNPHSGSYCMEYIQNKAQYTIVRPTEGIKLQKGKYYLATAYLRMKNHAKAMRAAFGALNNENGNILVLYKDYSNYLTIQDNWSGIIRESANYAPVIGDLSVPPGKWSEWVKVQNIIYSKADIPNAKIGLTTANATPSNLGIDDVTFVEITPDFTVTGDREIEIPKLDEEELTREYSVTAVLDGQTLPSTQYISSDENKSVVSYSLGTSFDDTEENAVIDGVSLKDNKLVVTNEAQMGEIILKVKHQENIIPYKIKLIYSSEKKPQIRNLKLNGNIVKGEMLGVTYTYYTPDGSAQESVECEWYGRNGNNDWEVIPGLNGLSYSVPLDFTYDTVKVKIKVKNTNGIYSTEEESNIASIPLEPRAENVKINGKHFVGEEIAASYDFVDENIDDKEGASIYKWYRSDTENGTYKPIDGQITAKYTITDDDIGKFIKFSVKPMSDHAPNYNADNDDGTVYTTAFEGPIQATVSNVRIVGKTQVGNVVMAEYDYYHKYGAEEAATVIEWYNDGTKVGTGKSLTLSESMNSLKVRVTVHAKTKPYIGDTAESTVVRVSSSVSGGSPGSSFGGRGSSKQTNTSTSIPTAPITPTIAEEAGVFADTANHWARNTIKNMFNKGYVNGVSKTNYEPDRSITRAEFCTIICRAFGIDGSDESFFDDVTHNDWFAGFINAAASKGIVKGNNGSFNPNNEITREEMAVMMKNLVKYVGKTLPADRNIQFEDSDKISDWAEESINMMSSAGLLEGSDNKFNPQSFATRAEAATVIERLINALS